MSEPVRIDDTLWEIPAAAREDMRVPARIFASADLLEGDPDGPLARAAAERRDAAGDRRRGDRDARHPLGLRLPDRRRRRDRAARRRHLARRRRLRHQLRRPPARRPLHRTARSTTAAARALVDAISRRIPTGAGRGGRLQLSGSDLDAVLSRGRGALVERRGIGTAEDVAATESEGRPRRRRPGRRSPSAPASGAPASSARSARATTSSRSSASRRSSTARPRPRSACAAARSPC